jgi:hypothetical protein
MDQRITELAHELKTPLTGVLGAIDLVLDSPVALDDTEVAELLAVARSEANQLRSIIDGVVQRTRLDAGTLQASRESVAAVQLVEDTLARFPSVLDRTTVVGDTRLVVSTDRSLAEQILTNLIQNVARYAPTGPVAVDLEKIGSDVHITVTDSGPGLPGGEVPSSKGLGVGLSTSRRLAETLDGSLQAVESKRGTGASFRFALPASNEAAPAVAIAESSTPPPRARLLQEVADLLVGTSLDRILTGVGRLARQMLGAGHVRVFERRDDRLVWLISEGDEREFEFDDAAAELLSHDNGTVTHVGGAPSWLTDITTDHLVAVTMRSADGIEGLLVVGWRTSEMPGFAPGVLPALAALALVGVDRRFMGSELEFERRVRAEVMNSLPIAISVFAGDPPRLIDWNQAEEDLLALADGPDRPEHLAESQSAFEVRFEDGTPLTMDNAPIVDTIRTGRSSGPFYLRLARRDGSEVVTRTHCAAIRDLTGAVIGAVVTSEPVGASPGSPSMGA